MASIEGQYAIATHARNATSLSEQQLISWCAHSLRSRERGPPQAAAAHTRSMITVTIVRLNVLATGSTRVTSRCRTPVLLFCDADTIITTGIKLYLYAVDFSSMSRAQR